MSKRSPAPPPAPLTGEILSHRRGFERFVLEHAEPWHRKHLGRLFTNWRTWNGEHFESRLEPPYLLLAEPAYSRAYGCCCALSGFGGRSEIRIRPSLVRGSHPHVEPGDRFAEGRRLFVDDVLLHEMIHQWQFEVLGDPEPAYSGHGPLFRDVANRIGAVLGLSPVRDCKRRGSDKHLPSCAQWPHIVRPEGFYLGAYRLSAVLASGDDPVRHRATCCRGYLERADHWIRRYLLLKASADGPDAAAAEVRRAVEDAIDRTLELLEVPA